LAQENLLKRSNRNRRINFLRRRTTLQHFQWVALARSAFRVTSKSKCLTFQRVTRLVRSEGGEDVSNFNGLPGWVKRLGAVRAHRCFSNQHQMLRCRLRLRCGSPAAALCCARLQPGMRVLGVADGSGAASLAAVRLVAKGCRHFSSVWGSTQASAVERVHCTCRRRCGVARRFHRVRLFAPL
jgi:hypothetical protein